jgi:hypothetical protein
LAQTRLYAGISNKKTVDNPDSFYVLYCINVHCGDSVFDKNIRTMSHLHACSLMTARLCPACQRLLVSEMDIELLQITAEADICMVSQVVEIERLTRLN